MRSLSRVASHWYSDRSVSKVFLPLSISSPHAHEAGAGALVVAGAGVRIGYGFFSNVQPVKVIRAKMSIFMLSFFHA